MNPSPTVLSDTDRVTRCLNTVIATTDREELILGYSTNPVVAVSVGSRLESKYIRLLWHTT